MDATHFTGFQPATARNAKSLVAARGNEASEHVDVRPATEQDEPHITTRVRGERLNPIGIDWPRFVIAVTRARLVGAVQLRLHADGARELGLLVVREEMRGRGIASRLIDALLASAPARVFMITGAAAVAARYER